MSNDSKVNQKIVDEITKICDEQSDEMLEFFREIVRIKSYTGDEGEVAKVIYKKMIDLEYDNVWQDKYGNIIGQIGNGETIIYFDSHMDTVGVNDSNEWSFDPFGAEIKDGKVYGRGSTDMKSGLVSSLYAGSIIKKLGYLKDKTIYVAATVMEEDFDGVATEALLKTFEKQPDYAIMCEPTSLNVGIGHKGRALIKITVNGKSAHGSSPELGVNPTYLLAKVLKRVEDLNNKLQKGETENSTAAVTTIESVTDSYNSIPRAAALYIDYRLSINDSEKLLSEEMDKLIEGIDAKWEICDFPAKTWTGEDVTLHSLHSPWEIAKDHDLSVSALEACEKMGRKDIETINLGFSTNAVTTAGKYKIPTIVIGPGDIKYAHMTDENCSIKDLIDACKIYAYICNKIP